MSESASNITSKYFKSTLTPLEVSIVEQYGSNSGLILEKLELYQKDAGLVDEYWQNFFGSRDIPKKQSIVSGSVNINPNDLPNKNLNNYEKGSQNGTNGIVANKTQTIEVKATEIKALDNSYSQGYKAETISSSEQFSKNIQLSDKVLNSLFEKYGHLYANTNPLKSIYIPQREGFSTELEEVLNSNTESNSEVNALKEVFCSTIGFEYSHLNDKTEREWISEKIKNWNIQKSEITPQTAKNRLRQTVEGELFEEGLHKKYVGAKRFSLEGGETMLPMLHALINKLGTLSTKEMIFGMAHRGRLSVLCNVIGKPLNKFFAEFEDKCDYSELGAGDVKYHKGYHSDYRTESGDIVSLTHTYNPSHLEFVNPVVIGSARAVQDSKYSRDRNSVVPVLMHGDAAFIGQGIVPETFNMSQVKAYFAGGTVHIVTNNQIGFTTSIKDSRSTVYCTDPYKGFDVPVFHVNAEDVDAACWLIELAAEYRQKFNKDVIVDLICWRKLGHNEGDDPTFTQPVEYSEIKAKKHISETYFETILNRGLVDSSELELQRTTFKTHFAKQQEEVVPFDITTYKPKSRINEEIQTQVDVADLKTVAEKLIAFPNGFTPHQKVKQLLEKRVQSLTQEKGIDWGFAETLAFGTLLKSGKHIRLVGQDAERATFSHRHLNIKDINVQGSTFAPLALLESNGASFEVYNSTLSENAATAYEYGYSLEAKDDLVLWEAQFGDFANGAQVIIDQFIASSEVKWKQTSGIVFLLPHGYEGQGPEHSSARLERFLQLCAEGNMRVCYPSNGAQYFHLLRDQGLRKEKRPLIVMTPKSLLRLHEAGSSIDELSKNSFKPIIETNFVDPKSPNKTPSSAIICSGKVYYDLLAEINAKNIKDIKVIRVEQLYPFPSEAIHRALKSIDRGSVKWVQEEPMNMGAWTFVEPKLRAILGYAVEYVGRPEAASTAEGSLKYHGSVQSKILKDALKST